MKEARNLILFFLIMHQGQFLFGQVPGTPIVFKSKAPIVSTLNCSGTLTGSLLFGSGYSGTKEISYTGGNGGNYVISVSSTGVTGLTASGSGTLVSGSGSFNLSITGVPSGSGTASFNVTIGAANCLFTVSVGSMTLTANRRGFVASVYDNDYLPYTMPTGPATTDIVNADGITETLINYQGILTTTGISVSIPYTVAVSSVTLPAFSQVVNVPATLTEDGISRDVELSYPGGTYSVGSSAFTATIRSLGGTLNVKKLDINAGIGDDFLGVLLAEFTIVVNSVGDTGPVELRAISAVLDRMFGLPDNAGNTTTHRFIYIPVMGLDGKLWLNNNLGANYSNINHASFSPAQQATSSTDHHAYGSLFQWGRKGDGHELINWTSSTTGTCKGTGGGFFACNDGNAVTTTLSGSDIPADIRYIAVTPFPSDWRTPQNANLWQGEGGINNPCPLGFRLPTSAELDAQRLSWSSNDASGALSSPLKLTLTGRRWYSSGGLDIVGQYAFYWSSTTNNEYSRVLRFAGWFGDIDWPQRSSGNPVRCIKD